MTDNEIVKALYCCLQKDGNCDDCPYKGYQCISEKGENVFYKDILDLINRQKADIENLNIELQAMRGAANSYKAEVKRYEKTVGTLATKKDGTVIATLIGNKTEYIPKKLHEIFKNMAVNRAKSEAIKEVTAELYNYFIQYEKYDRFHVYEILERIDSVEEMVGEKDV